MSQLYVLFEHAAGYALFHSTEFEELSVLSNEVQQSLQDLGKFRGLVQLVAFQPFKTSKAALENMNSISEGILHEDLQLFLETNLPKHKKKKKMQEIVLGVIDPKLSLAITELLGYHCQHGDVINEITRNIKAHFMQLVDGFTEETLNKSQLALALNYSRAKVKFNINRVDNMVIQTIALLDQLDKDLNTFVMRVREWYSLHFPELSKLILESVQYVQVVNIIRDRNEMPENVKELLEEVVMDSDKVEAILSIARNSMGMDISPIDLLNIEMFCSRVVSLMNYRQYLTEYLRDKMKNIAPNLSSLIGDSVGARLISHAGSLTNLAKYPASTVQILGAEKALFRALKTRGNTPKYGLIFHSTFIGRAAKQNKGRISRYLANKCSMASRIDCFSEVLTDVYGKKLKQQVEDRLKFYDTGDIPAKNLDIMSAAAEEAVEKEKKILKRKRKLEKREQKIKQEGEAQNKSGFESSAIESDANITKSDFELSVVEGEIPVENGLKKRKKKKVPDVAVEEANDSESFSPAKKKRKLNHSDIMDTSILNDGAANHAEDDVPIMKKKKKSKKHVEA